MDDARAPAQAPEAARRSIGTAVSALLIQMLGAAMDGVHTVPS